MHRFKSYAKILLSPAAIVFYISLALIVLSLVSTHRIRPYNSDDVSWQNILLSWQPFNNNTVSLGGSDNFITKVPFFDLLNNFFSPSRRTLFIESTILALTTFTLFYMSSLYFLRKLKIKLTYVNLLPFIWFSSFGFAFAQMYLNPILRNFEIGLSFVMFVLAAKLYFKEYILNPWVTRLIALSACLVSGVLVYSDPYFLYFTVAPIAILFTVLFAMKKISKQQLAVAYSYVALSLVTAKVVALLAKASGIELALSYPVVFAGFEEFVANISLSIQGMLVIFGANFFGATVLKLSTLSALVNASILALTVQQLASHGRRFTKNTDSQKTNVWPLFFGLLGLFVVLLYVFSTLAEDINTYRYFTMTVFSFILFLALTLPRLKSLRNPVTIVLCIATSLNVLVLLTSSSSTHINSSSNKANSLNLTLIDALTKAGLDKGYAPYWQSHINTYLSQGKIQFLPAFCAKSKTREYRWLLDTSKFSQKSERNFILIDPDLTQPPFCTELEIINQFGEPQDVIKVSNKTILIYDRNLSLSE